MNCKVVEQHSIPYLDGSIEPRHRRELEKHLSECAPCRVRTHELRRMWGLLDELPLVCPTAGFDAAVRARVAQEGSGHGVWGWLFAPSPRLAVGVTALMIFSVWLSSMPRVGRPQAPVASTGDADFKMIADLPVLEDYDVLADFEALSEVPVHPAQAAEPQTAPQAK